MGTLPAADPWRILYSSSNPVDTDNGYRPQNIFRLLTKSTWKNFTQQAYFRIHSYNRSASPNRQGYNAFLFFNRYKDGNNLYYTGIRVDGKAVIKKKLNGRYYTLALAPVFPGTYNRDTNPNLIPENKLIGLKSEVRDNTDGSVSVKVYMDIEANGVWKLVTQALDNVSQYGAVIRDKASAGIRADFMDVEFTNYKLTEK